MTKYADSHYNRYRRQDTPISIDSARYESAAIEDKAYYCSCNRRIYLQDISTGEYICRHCGISYYPEYQDVKSKSQFEPPKGQIEEPSVSYLPDPNEAFYNKKKVEPKGVFKEIQKRGIRLTSYHEYDANGRDIKR